MSLIRQQRRVFLNVILAAAAFALAPFDSKAREVSIGKLKRRLSLPDQEWPEDEAGSLLVADLILETLQKDVDLRVEIMDWLATNYLQECQAALDQYAQDA
jgi:hypothetical protein